MRKTTYEQSVLIGFRKRPAVLRTIVRNGVTTFSVVLNGVVIASRFTSKTQDAEIAIRRLAKAVSGLSYVFVVPVLQENRTTVERYRRGRS
ncbi:MAG: hypothetical protein HND47_00945 [Chloroflexi bacterium]|nr:hypothetical protein [Chloroflexota bacterium]